MLALFSSGTEGTADDRLLVRALRRRGADATIRRWDEPWSGAGVLRSITDYVGRFEEFLAFVTSMEGRVRNEPDVVRWNAHKGYLLDLAARGVATIPTRLLRAGEAGDVDGVCKPAIGAGGSHGRRSGRIRADRDLLLQPFIEGRERLLVFFRGEFSHGHVRGEGAYDPTPEERAVARHALEGIDHLYARVDLIGGLVSELELIEPDLYLDPASAARFAEAILG